MKSKLLIATLGALVMISAPGASAGTEVIADYGGRDMSQRYDYAPPPPPPPRPIYYAPPPVRVVVYPRLGYYHRPRVYVSRRPYWRHRHWRD
jgi:hypothetical protein